MASAPISANGSFTVTEDSFFEGTLPPASDTDNDFDRYVFDSDPANGFLSLTPSGSFSYEPLPDFHGSDSFTFSVRDLQGNLTTYTMQVTVTPVNDAPVWDGTLPAVVTPVSQARSLSIAGVRLTDADGDALALTATREDGSPLPAWLTFDAAAGRFTANPGSGDLGTVPIRLRASDGVADSDLSFNWTVSALAERAVAGKVLDGAIAGARLYLDLNGDNRPDLVEDTGLASGNAGEFGGSVFGDGGLIAVGGRDLTMPSASFNTLVLLAPQGASVITPLTTLIERLVDEHGRSVGSAQSAVKTALELPSGVDLLSFDPTLAADADATALAVSQAMSQVATVMAMAGDGDLVVSALADRIDQGLEFDLTDSASLIDLIIVPSSEDALWEDIAQINTAIAAATTRSAVAQAAAAAAQRFSPWEPALESAQSLLAALLAPNSGITLNGSSLRVQYGIGSDDAGAAAASLGRYAGGISGVDIGAGLILSSGDPTPRRHNEEDGYGTALDFGNVDPGQGDAQLLAAARAGFPAAEQIFDVTSIAFEFTVADPALRFVQFDVVFASDEYPEFSSEDFVDIAAVFVNGVNQSLFDGQPKRPLSVIDANLTSGAFVDNQGGVIALEYDGVSRKLAITAPVASGSNTIKIAVADVGDRSYDSALFIANLRAVTSGAAGLAQRFDGTEGDDTREGSSGGDLIVLYGGNDNATGQGGADYLDGGDGDDTLTGNAGPDTIDGGAGNDHAVFAAPFASYRLDLVAPDTIRVTAAEGAAPPDVGSAAGDTLVAIETLVFSDGPRSAASLFDPPPVPVLLSVTDDAGASTGVLSPGARTDDNRPALAGTAAAGLTVIVFDGDDELGRVVADSLGAWTFTPAALEEGAYSLRLRARNDVGAQSAATTPFNLVVDAVNSAPRSDDGAAALDEDMPLAGTLPPATDDDGDVLAYGVAEQPAHGQLTLQPAGSFSYTPAANYHGSDSFRFTVSDGRGGSATQQFTLTVRPVNDAPSGMVQVTGTARADQVLSWQNTLADADGLGAFSTQWQRDGNAIAGATGTSYTLVSADVGATISVRVSYTDGGGSVETVTSSAVGPVAGNAPITGGSGNDSLPGTGGIDTIEAGSGNDTLLGLGGDDSLLGGDGNDLLDAGDGNDTVDGGAGLDVLRIGGNSPIVADLAAGTVVRGAETDRVSHIEALIGSSAADLLRGSEDPERQRSDTLRGGGGDDTIEARSGNDTVEFLGPRRDYTVTRTSTTEANFVVADNVTSNGNEGTDSLNSVERLMFDDMLLCFGARAEELARVAFVLWNPAIRDSHALFARGISFYDVGYTFEEMSVVALQFWGHLNDAQLAAQLVGNIGGTTKTAALLLQTIATNGGAGTPEGRAAAVREMALDAATTVAIEASGIRSNGVVADLSVPGFGTLFGFVPG